MKLFAVVSVGLSLLSIINATPLDLTKRRFGQEHTKLADKTYQAMKDAVKGTKFEEVTGNLSGEAVRALLAKAPTCEQQDVADKCVDIAHQLGKEVSKDREKKLICVCQTYRKLERNTPKAGQPSKLCDRPPRNKELKGLVQAQDPTGPKTHSTKKSHPTTTKSKTHPTTKKSHPTTTKSKTHPTPPPENTDNEAFKHPVGGVQMPLIIKLVHGGPDGDFQVLNSKFQQKDTAHNRQCDVQHNLCFNKFNAGDRSFQGSDCDNQNNVCKAGPPVFAK
ncbi:hypothetical protein Glove_187g68 [Diversispora epigaea]|uniref:Uncharacterized protein n=1 Tax=Diversispora epigaea TaxID=1348612 RepID=A0A397IUY2_9GLOM|nr:hypothetical protein Glove_187g68 [Diversispora epigaea]